MTNVSPELTRLLNEQKLPASYIETVQRWLCPLASSIVNDKLAYRENKSIPLLVGIQGCQGSGKSTAALFLQYLLSHEHNKHSVILSLDDFYLTRDERKKLAADIHPLLQTRGVPGTHDIELLEQTIADLGQINRQGPVAIPRFDKSQDDRKPQEDWDLAEHQPAVIFLEGWCLGIAPQSELELAKAYNTLESEEDSQGIWRGYVNKALVDYQTVFSLFDMLVVLAAPSFDNVYLWREKQEQKLRDRLSTGNKQSGIKTAAMNPNEIKRFISHYQRLTEHALRTLAGKSDWWFELDENQAITRVRVS